MGILNDAKVQSVKIKDCGEPLVVLSENDFVLEPMYFNWEYCEEPEIKLRNGVYERLMRAREFLRLRAGFEKHNFKIWDGFRTLKTQTILYETYYDELRVQNGDWSESQLHEAVQIFVSRPSRDKALPAPHNTGGAVDLTIIDSAGNELDMGTKFDEFNERSYTNHFAGFEDLNSKKFHNNRMLFIEIMSQAGFVNYHEEWWHFSFGDQAWAAEKGLDESIYGSLEL